MTNDQKNICVKMRKQGFSKLTIAKRLRVDIAEVVAYVTRLETKPLPPVSRAEGSHGKKQRAAGLGKFDWL